MINSLYFYSFYEDNAVINFSAELLIFIIEISRNL